MDHLAEIERLIEPAVAGLGYEVVRVRMTSGRQATLQVMIERRDRRGMTVDDCARVSREISAVLDVADPIASAYLLEVSSPGIDRPLMKPADYVRFVGHEARLEVEPAIDGRKRFHGTIGPADEETVRLHTPDGVVALPFDVIRQAKLVLTDRLIAAAEAEAAADQAGAYAGVGTH